MTAKEYLMQLHILDTKITQKTEEYEQLQSVVKGKGISYEGDRVQTSPDNIQEKCIVEYTDIEKNINSLIVQYIKRKDKIINEIPSCRIPALSESFMITMSQTRTTIKMSGRDCG